MPHNRFELVINKRRLDPYSVLAELQEKQINAKIMITKLSLERRVYAQLKRKWLDYQRRIMSITNNFKTHQKLKLLRAIAHL